MDEKLIKIAELLTSSTFENWQKHKYPTDNDEILFIVLKAHLLIEEKLEGLIDVRFRDEGISKRLRLNFAQKVTLAEAISTQYLGRNWWDNFLWPTINELNRSRNELAHKLEPSNLPSRLANLVKIYDDLEKVHESSFSEQTGQVLQRVPAKKMTVEIKLRALFFNVLSELDNLFIGLIAVDNVLFEAFKSSGVAAFGESSKAMSYIQAHVQEKHL